MFFAGCSAVSKGPKVFRRSSRVVQQCSWVVRRFSMVVRHFSRVSRVFDGLSSVSRVIRMICQGFQGLFMVSKVFKVPRVFPEMSVA